MTSRFPRIALLVLIVGLALHNLAMALLWQAGVPRAAVQLLPGQGDQSLMR